MRHHCHCGFKEHSKSFRARKLGVVGVTVFVLHLLFHVAECLVLPSIVVGLGGHLIEEPASAISDEQDMAETNLEHHGAIQYSFSGSNSGIFVDTSFYQIRN